MTDNAKPKILVVDDNPINLKILINLLGNRYETFLAENGAAGFAIAVREQPDLIILDIHMPEMNGFEFFSLLKTNEMTRSLPVIFLTADTENAAKIKGLELGAVDYITKPFNRQEILARIRNQIELILATKSLLAANLELHKQKTLLKNDLQAAAEIQKVLLPNRLPDIPTLNFSWFFEPCQRVGGDIFNVIKLDENHVGIYIIDVCGHGVPAAMITSLVFQYLSPSGGNVRDKKSGSSDRLISPAELIKGIDKEFPFERFNRYFTMIYMILNFNTGHFTYCCAGHPPIFKLNAANDVELYGKGGAFIGMCDMGPRLEQGQGQLLSGERLFFYTDGIVEHENRVDQPFGQKRLIEVIQSTQAAPLEQAVKGVIQKVRTFADNKTPIDDFSLLGVELLL